MTALGLKRIIQKFENTDSFDVQSGSGRKKIIPHQLKKCP